MYALVRGVCPWLDEHLRCFIRYHDPDVVFVDSVDDIPSDDIATVAFQWCNGWETDKNLSVLRSRPGRTLMNAYPNSDSLVRRDGLAALVDSWMAKRPDSMLRSHVPHSVRLTLDYSEYVDEALMSADDLTLLASLGANEAKKGHDREWWVLKPAVGDCGFGSRIFSTVGELASHLELAEYEDDLDEDSEALSSEEEDEEEYAAEYEKDDSFSPSISLSLPGLDALDGIITTTIPQPDPAKKELWIKSPKLLQQLRAKKPQCIFKTAAASDGRIPSAQMRSFVAQRYIPSVVQWHVRVYVLVVGELKVHVYREMLVVLAGEDEYQSPWRDTNRPEPSATHTASSPDSGKDVSMPGECSFRDFWNEKEVPHDFLPGPSFNTCRGSRGDNNQSWKDDIFHQICTISAELFRAAAGATHAIPNSSDKSFGLFALDFLVDAECKAWLLEVHEAPTLLHQGGLTGPMATRLVESTVCVAMEHLGMAHIGEARNAKMRRRMVDVLDGGGGMR